MRFADATRAFFDDPARTRNNHWYWLGLAVGAVALATDSDRHWQIARGIMIDATRDIGADGFLPMELERGARALHYHAFAVMPLVVLAELGVRRGEDFYALGDSALHRLVAATANGLADPTTFDRRAGQAQERPVKPFAGWLPLYGRRFAERSKALATITMPAGHRWIGGDMGVLAQALAPR
jgi:poly(beta-D-mannuronate) lyase